MKWCLSREHKEYAVMNVFFCKYRSVFAGAVAAVATLALAPVASARDYVLIVLDRSGSMDTPSTGTPGFRRWEVAKQLAMDDLSIVAPDRQYAIWTFDGTTHIEHVPFSAGFTSADAQAFIASGFLGGPGSSTPLAGAVCDGVDELLLYPTAADDRMFLNLYSDGLENSTDPAHPCHGTPSANHADPTEP